MKNTKQLTAILTTAILISLMASSLVANAEVINFNVDAGTTQLNASYSSSSNSAKAAAAKYGDLLQPAYEWGDPWGNDPERTSFNPGPAPDRPDVLWTSTDLMTGQTPVVPKVFLGSQVLASGVTGGVNAPFVTTMSGAVMGFDGQIFCGATIRVNATNATTRSALISLVPHTGAVNWASIVGLGPTAGISVGDALFKIDDTHIFLTSGGAMFKTDGTFLWSDSTISPGGVYRPMVVVGAPEYKVFGPQYDALGTGRLYTMYGWSLADPDVNKGRGGRSIWNYTMDEPGNPMMCYGDGMLFPGSYSSCTVYALNATTGVKIWSTKFPTAIGYTGCYGDGKLFVGCQTQYETCLNGTTGEVIWRNTDGLANRAWNVYDINYAYGRVYYHDLGAGRTGAQKCYDANTGEKLWASTELHLIGYYLTVVGDGKIYGNQADASTTTGREPDPVKFCCWDAFTGEIIWSLKRSINTPTLVYGCLYFIEGGVIYCISTAFEPQPWSMFKGNVENPGVTLDSGPTDLSGGPKWTYTTGAAIQSSPVVANGKLYITSNDRYVYCLDAYNGSLIWRFLTNEPLQTTLGSTPAVVGDKVIIGPDDSNIYCLDANTGTLLWKYNAGTYRAISTQHGQHNIRSSPIIYNGRIYVGSLHDNSMYCLDLSGTLIWKFVSQGPISGSVAIENDAIYFMSITNRFYKLNMTGGMLLNFTAPTETRSSGSYTPVVVGDRIYFGVVAHYMSCFNATTGAQIFSTEQPHILSECSHGGYVFVSDAILPSVVNATGYTFGAIGGKLIGQAGPTIACMRPDNGSNIWSDWGGWEVFSTLAYSGRGPDAVIYYGSESYGIHCVNATNGYPISWYTTGGNIPSSPAIWDGKLYFGSLDNKVYCFEDHPTQSMAISMSLDKTTVDLNNTESVTVTAKLTSVPSLNPYEEIGRAAPVPPMPNATVLVTVTDSAGVDTNYTAITDNNGMATVTFTPNAKGTWKVIAWYVGEDHPTFSYGYAFSDQVPIEATQTITEPKGPTPPPGTNIPVEYVYAAIAVIVIVIIAAAALMLLRRRKK